MTKTYKMTETMIGTMPMLKAEEDVPLDEFINAISTFRKKHKGWYQFGGIVNGKAVSIKAYKCWSQIFIVDCVRHGGLHDLNVTRWKEELRRGLT